MTKKKSDSKGAYVLVFVVAAVVVLAVALHRRSSPPARPAAAPGQEAPSDRGESAPPPAPGEAAVPVEWNSSTSSICSATGFDAIMSAFGTEPEFQLGKGGFDNSEARALLSMQGYQMCLAAASKNAGVCDKRGVKISDPLGAKGDFHEMCVTRSLNIDFLAWLYLRRGNTGACRRYVLDVFDEAGGDLDTDGICEVISNFRHLKDAGEICSQLVSKKLLDKADCEIEFLPPGRKACAKKKDTDPMRKNCEVMADVAAAFKAKSAKKCPEWLRETCGQYLSKRNANACELMRPRISAGYCDNVRRRRTAVVPAGN